ncbi:MAG: hypothetical protein M5U34_27065 [Chloroflexi bacterium]|nr:hypothetical protein [Chloroflexota bacterium]
MNLVRSRRTTIAYAYDPLYRLTGADYSGDISASYAYAYDAVGNMAAYTETLVTDSGRKRALSTALSMMPTN